jgi:hypothetical protein
VFIKRLRAACDLSGKTERIALGLIRIPIGNFLKELLHLSLGNETIHEAHRKIPSPFFFLCIVMRPRSSKMSPQNFRRDNVASEQRHRPNDLPRVTGTKSC